MTSYGIREVLTIYGREYKCPGCGCPLEAYEVFVSRIRGLKRPVCYGCLATLLVFVKDYMKPMLEKALEQLEATAL